jgi:hypothetical protein
LIIQVCLITLEARQNPCIGISQIRWSVSCFICPQTWGGWVFVSAIRFVDTFFWGIIWLLKHGRFTVF